MKKILSTIVAALVAVSFAAVVFAEDVPYSERRDAPAPEMRRDEPRRDEVKPMKKQKKQKKHHRQKKQKEQRNTEEHYQR
jgi:Ni/Co efflux regulator RcnB